MVHALREAHRVLKPGGILIELRPAVVHRKIGIGTGRSWKMLAVMREDLADDRLATRAVKLVLRAGLFRRLSRTVISLDRVMDSLKDFEAWLGDFSDIGGATARQKLSNRIRSGLESAGKGKPIVIRAPLVLAVLRKEEPPSLRPGKPAGPARNSGSPRPTDRRNGER